MNAANCCDIGVRESIDATHPTTSTFRPNRARLVIIQKCRQLSDEIYFGQSRRIQLHPCVIQVPFLALVVQFVVAVIDIDTEEIWDCHASPHFKDLYLTRDGGFKIVPKVVPYAWMLATNTDCRNKQLPSYAGNLVFVLPVKNETPITYTIRITLYQKITEYEDIELDMKQLTVKSHERNTNLWDYQSGRTVMEVEKPLPRIKMSGVLSKQSGRTVVMHFQRLGDNGQYNQFLIDKQKLTDRVDGIVRYQDLYLAVRLEEAIIQFAQNKMDDCLAICRDVAARANRSNSGNWPFLMTKAYYIISAIHRQAENFDLSAEYMENSTECLEVACVSEETAVNKYNKAALIQAKSAAIGITSEEDREIEEIFEDVKIIWAQQEQNDSMRCINRMSIRMIYHYLSSSRQKFPDPRKDVSAVNIAKADRIIKEVENRLLPQCKKRFKATFLIAKADSSIRKALQRDTEFTEQERVAYLREAENVLNQAEQISRDLKMQNEIQGINDRRHNIQILLHRGFWLQPRPGQVQPQRRPEERNTDDIDDLLDNLLLEEGGGNRR